MGELSSRKAGQKYSLRRRIGWLTRSAIGRRIAGGASGRLTRRWLTIRIGRVGTLLLWSDRKFVSFWSFYSQALRRFDMRVILTLVNGGSEEFASLVSLRRRLLRSTAQASKRLIGQLTCHSNNSAYRVDSQVGREDRHEAQEQDLKEIGMACVHECVCVVWCDVMWCGVVWCGVVVWKVVLPGGVWSVGDWPIGGWSVGAWPVGGWSVGGWPMGLVVGWPTAFLTGRGEVERRVMMIMRLLIAKTTIAMNEKAWKIPLNSLWAC